jgi:hypothetical protein
MRQEIFRLPEAGIILILLAIFLICQNGIIVMTVLAGMACSDHCGTVQSDGLQCIFANGESCAGAYADAYFIYCSILWRNMSKLSM